MKKVMGIFLVLGILMVGGWAFSQEAGNNTYRPGIQPESPSGYSHRHTPPPPWRGPMWYYCNKVNPQSRNCQEMMEMMRENWQKMQNMRAKVWQEMRDYCQNHQNEEFCNNIKGWNKRENCPYPRRRGRPFHNWHKGSEQGNEGNPPAGKRHKQWHRMRMEGC